MSLRKAVKRSRAKSITKLKYKNRAIRKNSAQLLADMLCPLSEAEETTQ